MILILSATLVIVSLWGYTRIFLAVPSVTALFAGFDDELPNFSRAVFAVARYVFVFAPIGIVAFALLWQRRKSGGTAAKRAFVGVIAHFGIFLLVLSVWTFAIYLPILRMGAAVS